MPTSSHLLIWTFKIQKKSIVRRAVTKNQKDSVVQEYQSGEGYKKWQISEKH